MLESKQVCAKCRACRAPYDFDFAAVTIDGFEGACSYLLFPRLSKDYRSLFSVKACHQCISGPVLAANAKPNPLTGSANGTYVVSNR